MDHYRFAATRGATWNEEMICEKCGWAGVVVAADGAQASSASKDDGGRSGAAPSAAPSAPRDAPAPAPSASTLAARIAPCPRCGASGRARAAHLRGSVFVLMLMAIAGAGAGALHSVSVAFWILVVLGGIFALVALTRLVFWSTVKKDVKYVERAAPAPAAP